MKVATMRALRNGQELIINVSDFDPAIHQEIGVAKAKAASKKPESKAEKPRSQPPKRRR